MVSLTLATALLILPQPAPVADARDLSLAPAVPIVELDTGKIKGEPDKLAWSPDGSQLYVEAVERNRRGEATSTKHYLVSTGPKSIKGVDQPPDWAAKYWAWKAGQASPALAAFKIAVAQRQETKRATAAVSDLAKGGGASSDGGGRGMPGSTAEEAAAASAMTQNLDIYALKIGSETIGEWTNEPVVPGINFGWAPAPQHLIAFARREGGPIVILDDKGHKQELAGPRSATLPAWSNDATKLAWLERKDRKRFDIMMADISRK
jgi:hypothetical protein